MLKKLLHNDEVILALSLFLVGILTRLPFRSQVLYHWDSVNFALALDHFDVRIHQPQPPGYILYVLLGRAFNQVLADPNASLVCISVLFSGLTISAIFWLGLAMFGRQIGFVSAGLALTSPLFWFHGEVALSYIVEAFFVTTIAFCCYRQYVGDERYVLPAALFLGVAGGFRQNTLVLLFPLWLFSLRYLGWRKRFLAIITLVSVVGAWMFSMVYLSGGITNYWLALKSQSQGNLTISTAGSSLILLRNWFRLFTYSFYALTLGLPLLLIGLFWLAYHWRVWITEPKGQILLVWLFPSLIFYTFFVQQAGYAFTFMPAILLIFSFILVKFISHPAIRWSLNKPWAKTLPILIILLSNVIFFLTAPPFLFNQQKQLFNATSWPAIQARNNTVLEKLSYIRNHFPPESTAILANGFDFRLPDYYLYDYQFPSLSHQIPENSMVALGNDVKLLVLFNENVNIIDQNQLVLREETLTYGERLRWLERPEGQEFIVSAFGVGMKDKETD